MSAIGPGVLHTSDKSGSKRPIIGQGEHTYEVFHNWGIVPERIKYGNTHGVCVDANRNIYVHHTVHENSESADAMVIFDPEGQFVNSWGREFRNGAHGLHIQREDSSEFLYMCDINRSVVVKTTLTGEEIFTIQYPIESEVYQSEHDGTHPKYKPTNLAIAPNGDIYVGDGYGSSYILHFDKGGKCIRTFGGKGKDAGKIDCPHGLMVDTREDVPQLVVADRSNNRLQYFSLDGKHLKFVYGVKLPCHFDSFGDVLLIPDLAARVTLMDKNNQVIVHLGEGMEDWKDRRQKDQKHFLPGKFICPHSACFDHEGNIFVVEWVEIGRVTKLQRVN